jgi:pyruvate/2-oxoglutarate dehydrogenase complex dihydrolipoamide acyltransferase (E2) component
MTQTCRYKIVDGKLTTRMFGMVNNEWDIEPGWCHDKKEAAAAVKSPAPKVKPVDKVEVKATPFAKKLAESLRIDITQVKGTGKDGAISKDDVTNHYNKLES